VSSFSSWQDRKNEKCQQICQQNDRRIHNSHQLCRNSATTRSRKKFGAFILLHMEKNVQLKYRLYRRHNSVFYWQDNSSNKQGTLRTTDKREAERLVHAMNESHRQPTLNLNLARAYLAAHDPKMAQRTWQAVMDEMATHGIGFRGPSSQNEHGQKSAAKAKERSPPKNMQQSSLRKKIQSAAPTMKCFTKPAPRKQTRQISLAKISTGPTAFSFIAAKSSDRSPSRAA